MELITVSLVGLLMASVSAGQGGEGLLTVMKEFIKTEVSNQMKIERNVIKEEILKEIQNDKEKIDRIRKDLDSTREGNLMIILPETVRKHLCNCLQCDNCIFDVKIILRLPAVECVLVYSAMPGICSLNINKPAKNLVKSWSYINEPKISPLLLLF